MKPRRGELLAILPIFQRIEPLARPRLNYFSKTIYQPKDNQRALLGEIKNFQPIKIEMPVIVDTFINYVKQTRQDSPANKRYGDEDNLRKALSDALTYAQILIDDRFVVGGENYKWFGDEDCCAVYIWKVDGEDSFNV